MSKGGFQSYTGTASNAIRGTNLTGSDFGLVYLPPSFRVPGIGSEVAQPAALATRQDIQRMSAEIDGFWVQNNSGATGVFGPGLRIANRHWIAGQWDNSEAGSRFVNDTSDAQDRDSADDFTINTTADDDGAAIGCEIPFGWVSIDIDTDVSGADSAITTVVEFWTTAGAWSTFPATSLRLDELTVTASSFGTGETVLIFDPPTNWGKQGEDYGSGPLAGPDTSCPNGYYWFRVRIDANNTSTASATCSAIEIGTHAVIELTDTTQGTRGPDLNFYSPYSDGVVFINSAYGTGAVSYSVAARARG